MRKGKLMGYFKQKSIEAEAFEYPPPKRVVDMGVEPMPYYDRPIVLRALEALEWARVATPGVSRRAEVLFLARSLVDQGATPEDYEALCAFGYDIVEVGQAVMDLGGEW